MKILGYDPMTFGMMAGVFVAAGILMGIMVNVSIGKKFYDLGGIVGGVLTGLFMLVL